MIELRDISKKYDNRYVLENINLKMPRYGIVSIYGPSGCGKTTLLNVIASLCDYEGSIVWEGKEYQNITDKEGNKLRCNKIGFVFQDYKLFESETVKNNLLLALDIKSTEKRRTKERKIGDLLKIIGISAKENEIVSNLSGGEKQRLAIARAIINSPKVVLADEPTGNLDTANSVQAMELLQKIARRSLVILVSHDSRLVKEYSDEIVCLKDGVVVKVIYNHHNKHIDPLPLFHIDATNEKGKLPFTFCMRHALKGIKKRKWRTLFTLFSTSLGLFGVGLGTMLTDTISTNLYQSYSSIIDTNKVIVEKKKSDDVISNKITAVPLEDINILKMDYIEDVDDIGVYYWNDFESMFTNYTFSIEGDGVIRPLPSLTLRALNEFDDLDNIYNPLPSKPETLEVDEAVISLDILTLNEICYQLRIPKSVLSLSEYLTKSNLTLIVDVSNDNWSYNFSFPITIKAFNLARQVCFYHSNKMWNEYIFENALHLSTSPNINGGTKNPWDLRKSYYLEFIKNRDAFLEKIKFDKKYRYMIGEILDEKYYPISLKDKETHECNRVCILSKEYIDDIDGFLSTPIKDTSKRINSLLFGSEYSYAIYPDNLMMGFAREAYLSKSKQEIDEIIDLTTYLKYEESMNITPPETIIEGHFSKPVSNSLTFNASYQLLEGREPTNYQEIIISVGALEKIGLERALNKDIFLAFPIKEDLLPNGYLNRSYKTASLKVVGISDSNKYELSHNEKWTIMFFQTMLGVSSLDLKISSLALSIDEGYEDEAINAINRAFPSFNATSPIRSVKASVDSICKYIEIILNVISISSVIIASLLLLLCNHLHYLEIKKDIGLIRCLGIDKSQASKMIYSHTILMVFLPMIFAVFELIIASLIMSKAFSEILSVNSGIIFNPLSILYMFIVAVLITLLSSINIKRRINSLKILDCLR